MKKVSPLLFLVVILLLTSCDAVSVLCYRVKNTTKKPVYLRVEHAGHFENDAVKDTVVLLQPGSFYIVGRSMMHIGFPGEEAIIFKKYPSMQNFTLVKENTTVMIDAGDSHWIYGNGYSTFRITKKNLPAGY